MKWRTLAQRAEERYHDGIARLSEEPDPRQKQLTRVANSAWAVGLCLLMEGRQGEAADWLGRAAGHYRESYADAPSGSWGRLIGTIKARLLAEDPEGVVEAARWALAQGPVEAESPIGRYAAALALLALGDDTQAARLAKTLQGEPEERFPRAVADALLGLATRNRALYELGARRTLRSFEAREAFLEEVPVADTVLVVETLAALRGLAAGLESPLLPS